MRFSGGNGRNGTRRRIVAWFLLLALLPPLPALGQDRAVVERMQSLIVDSQKLQDEGHHEEAITRLDEALSLNQHPYAKYLKAKSLQSLGLLGDARELYLDVWNHPWLKGEIQQELDRRLKAIDELLRPVTVFIETTPSKGARVYLDRRFAGESPVEARIPPGEHTVTVRLKGYRTVRDSLLVTRPGPVQKSYPLLPARYGLLSVETDVGGADVFVDDIDWAGTTPLKAPLTVEEGRHVVRVSRMGFVEQLKAVTVTADALASVSFSLQTVKGPKGPTKFEQVRPVVAKSSVGVGVAVFVMGVGFLGKYLADRSSVSGRVVRTDPLTNWTYERGADHQSSANAIAGGVLMGIGALLGATGGILWPRSAEETR